MKGNKYILSALYSQLHVVQSSFPHLFPLLCGVDVSYDTPPFSPVLGVLPGQFSLRQVVPDAIQPPLLWYSCPSIPRHLHRHHSLAYAFVFSSQYMPIPLQYYYKFSSDMGCRVIVVYIPPLIVITNLRFNSDISRLCIISKINYIVSFLFSKMNSIPI